VKIINNTGHSKIDEAINYFFKVFPDVVGALAKLPLGDNDFTYTKDHNAGVVHVLNNVFRSDVELEIKLYRPKNPFSAAIGYTAGGNAIYINERKLHTLTYLDYAGNIAHEFCHFAGYAHGDNYINAAKKKSVPYAIGYLVSGESSFPLVKEETFVEKVTYYRSWKSLWVKKYYLNAVKNKQ
jgi:hypothetical protein